MPMTPEQVAAIREAALQRIKLREAEQAAKQQQTQIAQAAKQALQVEDESKDDPIVPFDNGGMKNILNPNLLAKPLLAVEPFRSMLASIPTAFNAAQQAAIELALEGKSFCLIGAAGTGKTTVTQTIIKLLQASDNTQPLSNDTKWLDKGAPGIVIVGFTNKAVNNIKKKLPPHLQKHCLTIHKLIEFQPVYYDVPDPENPGKTKKTMQFEPGRNAENPLPHISTIIIEESSMVGTDLYDQLIDALPMAYRTQMVFLGDLNQLPPVFGPSILGFQLAELATVELTHVYRQALLSPIISLATAIRTNVDLTKSFNKPSKKWYERESPCLPENLTEVVSVDKGEHGKLTIRPWKKRVHEENAIAMMKQFIPTMISSGAYNPVEDMILIPFNKAFGTIEVNRIIGDYLAKRDNLVVHEVIARYQKSYWAVGDRVMVDRQEAIIRKIEPTVGYFGKAPRRGTTTMDRWGDDPMQPGEDNKLTADQIINALDMLELKGDDSDDAKNLASHTITVWFPDSDVEQKLNTAGTINQMIFGWALTVHKSQGSEWERVFLFLHNTHAKGTLMSRELLYTAVTRAKHELYIICEGDIGTYTNSLTRGADRPSIPGTKLYEKIEFFRKKLDERRNGSNSEVMEDA